MSEEAAPAATSTTNTAVLEKLRTARHYDLQAAGHAELLALDNGLLVKPCTPRERQFYEEATAAGSTSEAGVMGEFRTFMPRYFGSLRLATEEERSAWSATGTALPEQAVSADRQNVTYGYCKPCVMDLKIGKELCSDDASPEKRARMEAKASNSTTSTLGIRICGIVVYDQSSGKYTSYNKTYGYGLTDDTIIEGFKAYFSALSDDNARRAIIMEELQDQLEHFRDVLRGADVRLRSASLLFVYEADPEGATEMRRKAPDGNGDDLDSLDDDDDYDDDDDDDEDDDDDIENPDVDLRIVDFAHSFWQSGIGPDHGCLQGVQNAIAMLKKLRQAKVPSN
ncbi:inositol polyphosphate kinase-domain-containing protein [Syncephalis pseudoplumigaleata]|uniref:Kinase n=1 Tax=Syncephalis pseudoplumigaleata TaxID=1712513 RepID=A0A4P9YSV7_9FUNG|nr:inositol polyphosphate kinase-domain-containing protein [Syncephalis pseudoplumigaleata]|eukprot:RKP22986.1 inositol polyphosphate kinase-domain-containing protein [Syncephalis pseudoplumigaleata]